MPVRNTTLGTELLGIPKEPRVFWGDPHGGLLEDPQADRRALARR
jgi:hypothetical protein